MPISSSLLPEFIKIQPMDLLFPIVTVGALVAWALNQMLFVLNNELYDPGEPKRLILTDSMSFGLFALENNGERENTSFVGLLAV